MNCFHWSLFAFHFIMLLYNVTIKIDWSIHDEWLAWMQDIHIPEVLGTGCFYKHQLVKILDTDETGGTTYAVQYYAESQLAYEEYSSRYADGFRKVITEKWGEQVFSFRTLMMVIN